MPQPINWPNIPQALQKLLGLKGRVVVQLDEMVVPTVQVADVAVSPFSETRLPAGNMLTAGAVLARFSGLVLRPADDTILVVRRVVLINQTGAQQAYLIGWQNNAAIATFNLGASTNMLAFNAPRRGAINNTASFLTIADAAAAAATSGIQRVHVPNNDQVPVDIVGGFALWGSDPDVGGLSVFCSALNTECRIAVYVDEYRLAA